MKNYPEIYEAKFGYAENGRADEKITAADAATNSALLRAICKIVEPKFSGLTGEFSTGRRWQIRLIDQHDDHAAEPYPHYVLDVGEGGPLQWGKDQGASISVAYCDNHSTYKEGRFVDDPVNFNIEQEPGRFAVTVMGDFGGYQPRHVAKYVGQVYANALEKYFPDYFVIIDETPLED